MHAMRIEIMPALTRLGQELDSGPEYASTATSDIAPLKQPSRIIRALLQSIHLKLHPPHSIAHVLRQNATGRLALLERDRFPVLARAQCRPGIKDGAKG